MNALFKARILIEGLQERNTTHDVPDGALHLPPGAMRGTLKGIENCHGEAIRNDDTATLCQLTSEAFRPS